MSMTKPSLARAAIMCIVTFVLLCGATSASTTASTPTPVARFANVKDSLALFPPELRDTFERNVNSVTLISADAMARIRPFATAYTQGRDITVVAGLGREFMAETLIHEMLHAQKKTTSKEEHLAIYRRVVELSVFNDKVHAYAVSELEKFTGGSSIDLQALQRALATK